MSDIRFIRNPEIAGILTVVSGRHYLTALSAVEFAQGKEALGRALRGEVEGALRNIERERDDLGQLLKAELVAPLAPGMAGGIPIHQANLAHQRAYLDALQEALCHLDVMPWPTEAQIDAWTAEARP